MRDISYEEFVSCPTCNKTPFKVNGATFTACVCSFNGIYSADITLKGDGVHSTNDIHVDIIPSIEHLSNLLSDLL